MATRSRARIIRNARRNAPTAQAPQTNPLADLEAKFSRLTDIRQQLTATKELHKEHDRLVEELLPLFVTQTADGWDIKKRITLGSRTHKIGRAHV